MNEEEASLFDVLWLLLASVIFVPIFQKIPGGDLSVFFSINFDLSLCDMLLESQCEIAPTRSLVL